MELNNTFEVARPIDEAWAVLTDIERIAPCLPGAQLTEIEGDDYRGFVKVKVGPITAQFKGSAHFVERHDEDYRAVLNAKGRDTRGAGNASALITATLEPVSEQVTKVTVNTDMKITGKFAQFGRGVMADVSANLMDQFAQNLAAMLADQGAADEGAGDSTPEAEPEAEAATEAATDGGAASQDSPSGARKVDMPEVEAIDLIDAAGAPLLKRLAPVVGAVLALWLLRRVLRRCCSSRCC